MYEVLPLVAVDVALVIVAMGVTKAIVAAWPARRWTQLH
jgi:hypothetical protein